MSESREDSVYYLAMHAGQAAGSAFVVRAITGARILWRNHRCLLAQICSQQQEKTTIMHALVFSPTSMPHQLYLFHFILYFLDALQAIKICICFEGSVDRVFAMTDAEYLITDSSILRGIGPGSFHAQNSILPQQQLF
ncbi:hypothetical protein FB446DRAFT_793646 [Lentinula raphanica]|nr:hypothetical protein FB446DRAFT_793646 [Lentinula raphanica]